MRKYIKLYKIIILSFFIVGIFINYSLAQSFSPPTNLKDAYNKMQLAYKSAMKALDDFKENKISSYELDKKLQEYVFYKQEYEKLLKIQENTTPTPNNYQASNSTQSNSNNSNNYSQNDSINNNKIPLKLKQKIDVITKYDSSIAKEPKIITGLGKYWRDLIGANTVDDLISDGYLEFKKGNYSKALLKFEQAHNKDPFNKNITYYIAMCYINTNEIDKAEKLIEGIYNQLKDEKWLAKFREFTNPWVEEEVAFKIGGFDSLEEYRKKIAAGNRKELHGDEYYEKYVNPRTFKFYSEQARREFESIAGIDCGGFVQRVYMDMCKAAGIKPPFTYKLPGRELQKHAIRLKDDGLIPPMSAKPGDFILLKEHDGWGHAFYFAGRDKEGYPLIVEASGEGKVLARRMPDRYYSRYDGTYKFKDMDKIREKFSQLN